MNHRCEDHAKSNQENQRYPGAWLNSKNNIFSDGISRQTSSKRKYLWNHLRVLKWKTLNTVLAIRKK